MNSFAEAGVALDWFLNASLQAALLVPVILLAQGLLRHRLSARWRFALWWLLILRLLLPVSFASPWSIFNYVQPQVNLAGPQFSPPATADRETVTLETVGDAAPVQLANSDSPPIAVGVPAEIPQTVRPVEVSPAAPRVALEPTEVVQPEAWRRSMDAGDYLIPLIWAVWFLVALALLAAVMFQSIAFSRRLRAARQHAPVLLNDLLAECRRVMGIRRGVVLLETEAVTSPVLYGLFRHRILLPWGFAERFSPEELRHVLLHELAHLKRGDLWLNWLVTALQIVHWFNPLVWLGFARLRADRELACDELALFRSGADTGRDYGRTMLKLLEDFARPKAMPGLVGILEDKQQMQRRVRMIARFKRPSRWSALALIPITALGLVLLTDAQVPESRAPEAATAKIGQASNKEDQPNSPTVGHLGEVKSGNFSKPIFELRLVESAASDDTETLSVLTPAGDEAPANLQKLFVRKRPLLDATALASANVGTNEFTGRPDINIEFTAEGQARFAEVTRQFVGRQLAFVINGQVASAPVIAQPITGGKAIISGSFTREEAERLARLISDHVARKSAGIVPAASSAQAPARFVEITTEIEFENWAAPPARDESLIPRERQRTRAVIGTNSWMIESDWNGRVTRWFTGTRIIARGDAITGYESGDTSPAGLAGVDSLMGFDLPAAVTWQAFGSGPAHRRDGAKLYPPSPLWEQARLAPAAWSERTEIFRDGLGLPKSINLVTADGESLYWYQVLAWTNVLGWNVPTEFQGVAYRRRPASGSEAHLTFEGRVTAITLTAKMAIPDQARTAAEASQATTGRSDPAPAIAGQNSVGNTATNFFVFDLVTPAQALEIYHQLSGRELIVSTQVTNVAAFVGAKSARGSREELAKEIRELLLEQAGLVITELDGNRASVTYNEVLGAKSLTDPTGRPPPPLGPDGKGVIKPDSRPRVPPPGRPSAPTTTRSTAASAPFVEIEVEIEIEDRGGSFGSDEINVSRRSFARRCIVGTNSWMIESATKYVTSAYWFSGTNFVMRSEKTPAALAYQPGVVRVAAWRFDSSDGNPGRPRGEADLIMADLPARLVWQAFCSGPVLKSKDAKLFPPSEFWKQTSPTDNWSTRTDVFSDGLGLPKSIDLVLSDGQPIYEYRVSRTTQFKGWNLPEEFHGVSYRAHRTGGWEAELRFTGRITAISSASEPVVPAKVVQAIDASAGVKRSPAAPGEPAYPYTLETSPRSFTRVSREGDAERVKLEFLKWANPDRNGRDALFRVTNPGSREVLIWNVRQQVLATNATGGLEWRTTSSDYPGGGWEKATIPTGGSTVFPMSPVPDGDWRVCLLYSRLKPELVAEEAAFRSDLESIGPVVKQADLD